MLQVGGEHVAGQLHRVRGDGLGSGDLNQPAAVPIDELPDFGAPFVDAVAAVLVVLFHQLEQQGFAQAAARRQRGPLLVRLEDAHQQQIIQHHPPGIDQAFGNGPVVVALLLGGVQQLLRQVDGAPAAAEVEGLVAAEIPEVEQAVVADEGQAHRLVDQGLSEIRRDLLQHFPQQQNQRIASVQLGQADIVRKIGQTGLLSQENDLVRRPYGPVDLLVVDLTVEDAQVDLPIRKARSNIHADSSLVRLPALSC